MPDEKVLAVPFGDPYSEGLSDLGDIPRHYLKEIEHFFQVYKDLEGTRTETRGFEGAAAPGRPWCGRWTCTGRGSQEEGVGIYRSRSETGGPRISRHTIASRSCAGV